MEQLQIQSKSGNEELIVVLDGVTCLKDIILDSKKYKDQKVIVKVPYSRFKIILSQYWALNGINLPEWQDIQVSRISHFYLSQFDNTGNVYKVVKLKPKIVDGQVVVEKRGKCSNCNCDKKRWVNPNTGVCYYKEMLNNNYTTKL